jgi:imidazolonepropionase-like amidohydrolase
MRMATLGSAIVLALLLGTGVPSPALVIEGGSLVDTRTGQISENGILVVEGDRIARVARVPEEAARPGHARIVDARGRWILPGLIDMHVHGSSRRDVPLALYLANGVTSVRDLGGPLTLLRQTREQLESGKRVGPRLFFAGPILDGDPPLSPSISIIVDTPARAVSAVDFLVDQSVDAIKVYNGISGPVLQALVQTARRRGVPVVGHVPRAMTATSAVEAGLRVIEHSPIRAVDLESWGILTPADAQAIQSLPSVTAREAMVWRQVDLKDEHVATLVTQLAAAGVFLDPTLSTDEFDSLFLYPAQASHVNNRFLERTFVEEALGPEHDIFKVPDGLAAAAAAGVEKRRAFVGMCHRAGVRIVAGTDGPGIGSLAPGFGLHRELELLVEAGLTPMDAVRAATFDAAAALGRAPDLGVIEKGKLADILIVRADPRVSVVDAAAIDAVVVRGQVYDRAALDGMLDEVAAEATREK